MSFYEKKYLKYKKKYLDLKNQHGGAGVVPPTQGNFDILILGLTKSEIETEPERLNNLFTSIRLLGLNPNNLPLSVLVVDKLTTPGEIQLSLEGNQIDFDFMTSPFDDFPFMDPSHGSNRNFDLVINDKNTIHYVPLNKRSIFIESLFQKLKPNGRLLLRDVSPNYTTQETNVSIQELKNARAVMPYNIVNALIKRVNNSEVEVPLVSELGVVSSLQNFRIRAGYKNAVPVLLYGGSPITTSEEFDDRVKAFRANLYFEEEQIDTPQFTQNDFSHKGPGVLHGSNDGKIYPLWNPKETTNVTFMEWTRV